MRVLPDNSTAAEAVLPGLPVTFSELFTIFVEGVLVLRTSRRSSLEFRSPYFPDSSRAVLRSWRSLRHDALASEQPRLQSRNCSQVVTRLSGITGQKRSLICEAEC